MSGNDFFRKKKQPENTSITLNNIDIANLDKQYVMKDITEAANKKLKNKTAVDSQVELKNITSNLESLGITKEKGKVFSTVLYNTESKINLFYTPKLSTNLASVNCWYCRHGLIPNTQPLSIPLCIESENPFKVKAEGVVCSFNCMLAYITEYDNYKYKDSASLIHLIYHKIFPTKNILISDLKPAPSWKLLKPYGGELTIDEYRKSFQIVLYKPLNQHLETEEIIFSIKPEVFAEI